MPQSATSSFWDRTIIVAVVAALLGGIGYLIKEFVIERDKSDLVIRAEQLEQILPLSQKPSDYQNNKVYCEVVKFDLVISHNQEGEKPIRIKRLSLETEKINLETEGNDALTYKLDASATLGFGIVQLKEYAFSMDGDSVEGNYMESTQKAVKVNPNNVLESTRGRDAITIEHEGDSAFLQLVIVLETAAPGLYKARTRLYYEIAGTAKEEETPWVYVFML